MPRSDPDEPTRKYDDDKASSSRLIERSHKGDAASIRSVSEDEVRRSLRWLAFSKPRLVFGFDHLPPAQVPSMSNKFRGLSIGFEKIIGWRLPTQIQHEVNSGQHDICAQLSLSLYHINSGSFFGTTWMGAPLALSYEGSDYLDLDFSDVVYILSRLTDPSCVGVVELVISKIDIRRKLTTAQYGCGWTIVNLFSQPSSPDLSDGYEKVPLMSCTLFQGTPRDLALNSNAAKLSERLKEREIPGCSLQFKSYSHRQLLKIQRLVAENETVGRFDVLPGTRPRRVVLPGSTETKAVPCIGDEAVLIPGRRGGEFLIPAKPSVCIPATLTISNIKVMIPDRSSVEARICDIVAKKTFQSASSEHAQIVSRSLKIGLHNGHTVLGGEWQSYALKEMPRDGLSVTEESVTINGYVPHELMALVLLLEYEVGIAEPVRTSYNAQNMLQMTGFSDNKPLTTVTVGMSVFIPFDGRRILLQNRERGRNDNEASGIELGIISDDMCSVFSPKALLLGKEELKVALGKQQTAVAKSNRRSSRREAIDSDDEAASKPNDDEEKDDSQLSATGVAVSFELSAFDAVRGKLEHEEEYTMDLLGGEDSDAVPAHGDHSPLAKASDRQAPRVKPSDSTVPRRAAVDLEDAASISESIVAGGSESSSLRLEPRYYGNKRDSGYTGALGRGDRNPSPRSGSDAFFVVPKDAEGLLAKSLQAKLFGASGFLGPTQRLAAAQDEFLRHEDDEPFRYDNLSLDRRIAAPLTAVAQGRTVASVGLSRDLSRAARSRLSRHGFDGAMMDSGAAAVPAGLVGARFATRGAMGHADPSTTGRAVIDLELEAKDDLLLHEIGIQFAGYRAGSSQPDSNASTDRGQLSILSRDEAHARDEAPLILRHSVDCSDGSEVEPLEFAEYMAQKTLFVDVWDADSLMLLGTFGLPLRRLMRQGQSLTRTAIECDVVDSEVGTHLNGGIASSVISEGQPTTGAIVGAVQVVATNHGLQGHYKNKSARNIDRNESNNDLNWRARGQLTHLGDRPRTAGQRPKTSVRARPLSEGAPELARAIRDQGSNADKRSLRSLTASRGLESSRTLTYDEVANLFKRFQGTVKGTIQYAGALMALLDAPSRTAATNKLLKLYSVLGDVNFEKELTRFADGSGRISTDDLQQALRSMFERQGVPYRAEEVPILAHHLSHGESGASALCGDVVAFCRSESERHEWRLVSARLRRLAQKAVLLKVDIEQLFAEKDFKGSHFIAARDFKDVLRKLSDCGKLSAKDINTVAKHFTSRKDSIEGAEISLKEVMAFLGQAYVGNMAAHIAGRLCSADSAHRNPTGGEDQETRPASTEAVTVLRSHCSRRGDKEVLSLSSLESAFVALGVYSDLTHGQVKDFFARLDSGGKGEVNISQLLARLRLRLPPGLLPVAASRKDERAPSEEINTEFLLRLLLQQVQRNGLAVDEAFRHFDTDGDGRISGEELQQGLDKLHIFDNIPDWRSQMPDVIAKFDKNGDGLVSLKEFFGFLGIESYAPNIVQRMTKIFALAEEKGLSLGSIFAEFDEDGDGKVDAAELRHALVKVGSFGEVSEADAAQVVSQFDSSGDGKITLREFEAFLSSRVQQLKKDKKRKKAELISIRFRNVMKAANAKGVSVGDLFGHLDKNKGGSISSGELVESLRSLPHFKGLSDEDIDGLVSILDVDNSGEISLAEFKSFLALEPISSGAARTDPSEGKDRCSDNSGGGHDDKHDGDDDDRDSDAGSSADRLAKRMQAVFRRAAEKGLTFQNAFKHLDADGSGQVSADELHKALLKIPHFRDLSPRDAQELVDTLDADGNGIVSLPEFEEFLRSGRTRAKARDAAASSEKKGAAASDKDLMIAAFERISEKDGGLDGLLAFLDDDEDGLITISSLMRLLRREGALERLSEEKVRDFLLPAKKGDNVSVIALQHLLSGRDFYEEVASDDEDKENMHVVSVQYEFSSDPETKALEKKIQHLGRVLARSGADVEGLFRGLDIRETGLIRRTEFLEVLSKLGLYILEQGKALDNAVDEEGDMRRQQLQQARKLQGQHGSYEQNAARAARRLLMSGGEEKTGDFREHMESMALVSWYRQSQKKLLLQRVLTHSLASSLRIYPRFGKAVFFEHPITNPFGHEERFLLEVEDAELRLVTSFDEWIHLRERCRPSAGELGPDPVEAEMFDRDAYGHTQVALLPHETLHIPFTFMTLVPTQQPAETRHRTKGARSAKKHQETKSEEGKKGDSDDEDLEEPARVVDVRVVSSTHGHVVAVLRVNVCPRPFLVHRVIRLFEPEGSVMRRRIQLLGYDLDPPRTGTGTGTAAGAMGASSKYVHCVEGAASDAAPSADTRSRVVVEWGQSNHVGALDLLLRYKCGSFPSVGSFHILIYNDPYQCELHEVWHVIVEARQKIDVHCTVGSASSVDLVVPGDRFARRVKVFASPTGDKVATQPAALFQLVPGALNRVSVQLTPRYMGIRRARLNLVDVDSREIVSAWLLSATVTAPAVTRQYEVEVADRPINKKVVFKNPWDVPRRFTLTSSNEAAMRTRLNILEVAPFGSAYLRLWFAGPAGSGDGEPREAFLFFADDLGQIEESFLFRIHTVK